MKILVVDDDTTMLAILEVQLEEMGQTVELAADGEQALAMLGSHSDFDLVLTDLRMPRMDGLELITAIHKRKIEVPCAVMSALNDMSLVIRSLRLNAIDFLPKPITKGALADLIQRVRALSPALPVSAPLPALYEAYQTELPSRRDWVPELCRRIVERFLGDQSASIRETVRLALHESVMNAVVHGNLGVSSAAKAEDRWEDFEAEVEACEQNPELSGRPVLIKLKRQPDRFWVLIRDLGKGFARNSLPPADGEGALSFCGRGVILIRHCMDAVDWNEAGNQIEMVKLLFDDNRAAAAAGWTDAGAQEH